MTRLSVAGTRAPVHAHELSEEDRATYRRWARRSYAAYFFIIVALAVSLSLHRPAGQLASRDQTAHAGTATTTEPHPTGAISRSE